MTKVFKLIIVLTLFFCMDYIVLIPVKLFNLKDIGTTGAMLLSVGSNILLLFAVVAIYFNDLKKEFKIFKSNINKNLDTGFKYWIIGLAGMVIANSILIYVLGIGQAANEQVVQKLIKVSPFLMIISAGILAPIIEELSFRKTFRDVFKNDLLFIIISGTLFGALHVVFSFSSLIELLYIIPYSCLGIGLAISYAKTKTVFTPISMHMLHNMILTVAAIIRM